MIHIYIPGLGTPSKQTRYGDGQIINDGKNYLVIDGFCDKGTDILIKKLKEWDVKSPILAISHAHYDHNYGIYQIIKDDFFTPVCLYCYDPKTLEKGLSNNKGSKEVRSDINYMNKIIDAAKAKNIPVKFLSNGQMVSHGDIAFKVFRNQPTKVADDDTEGWSYVNDGSLCFYFYELGYWTSGDGPEKIYDFAKKCGAKVKFFKIPHHGNNCTASQARGLYSMGAKICWYNDLEPDGVGTNDFTLYGARRCKEAGIQVLNSFTDINILAMDKKVYIYYKAQNIYNYSCLYEGKRELKEPDVNVIRDVFMNKYKTGDTRITNLIRAHYSPGAVSREVTLVVKLAKQIINGQVNFGKNEERIKRIDTVYGKGYGQLIQDEINSLLGSKSAKW